MREKSKKIPTGSLPSREAQKDGLGGRRAPATVIDCDDSVLGLRRVARELLGVAASIRVRGKETRHPERLLRGRAGLGRTPDDDVMVEIETGMVRSLH